VRALVILDHGSRAPEAHAHLLRLAEAVARLAPDLRVRVAHLEQAEPGLPEAIRALAAEGAREISVHPLFLAPGRHLEHDVPAQLRAARAAHPGLSIRLCEPLGSRPELAELILRTLDRAP
jgi:sirohydrochlorin cobaltochelatase